MQYKKDEIQESILRAALNEFENKGYRGAIVANIAKAAGVPVGNLYRYFKSKEELFDAVVYNVSTNLPHAITEIYEQDVHSDRFAKETFLHIAEALLHIYNEYGRELLLLIDNSAGTKYENFFPNLMKQITSLFESGLSLTPTKENHAMCAILAKGFIGGLFDILREPTKRSREILLQKLMLFYFYKIEERIV